jgi:hypothetical protein
MSASTAYAGVWIRRVAWVAAALSAALNLVLAPRVLRSAPQVQNAMGALWLFGTHAALVLAVCLLVLPRARGAPLTRPAAAFGLALALLSLVALPVSYAATKLFEHGPFQRLF